MLLAIGFSFFSLWCTDIGQLCYRTWLDRVFIDITSPLYFLSLFLLPIALIIAFVPRRIFNAWFKFALWAIPLSVLYIWNTPVTDTSFLPFTRDDAARKAGLVFALASLICIALRPALVALNRLNKNAAGLADSTNLIKEQIILLASITGSVCIAIVLYFGDRGLSLSAFELLIAAAFFATVYAVFKIFGILYQIRSNSRAVLHTGALISIKLVIMVIFLVWTHTGAQSNDISPFVAYAFFVVIGAMILFLLFETAMQIRERIQNRPAASPKIIVSIIIVAINIAMLISVPMAILGLTT